VNGKEKTSSEMRRSLYLKIGSAQGSSPTDPGLVGNDSFHLINEKY
jgi:hypothetical protein